MNSDYAQSTAWLLEDVWVLHSWKQCDAYNVISKFSAAEDLETQLLLRSLSFKTNLNWDFSSHIQKKKQKNISHRHLARWETGVAEPIRING